MAEQDSGVIRQISIAIKTYYDKKSSKEIKKATDEVKKLSKETKKSGEEASKSSGGFEKLLKSIGRIAFYRAIRSMIRAVTSAVRDGIGNLYQWSKLIDESFSKSLDSLSTSVLYLKNGIAVGLAPVIEAFIPILVRVADAVAQFGNAVSAFFAILNGDSTYRKAVKASTEFAKSTGAAYKEAKDFLFGFDELNVFNNDQSGGGAGGAADFSNMFAEEDVANANSKIKEVAENVRKVLGPVLEWAKGHLDEIKEVLFYIVEYLLLSRLSPALAKVVVGLTMIYNGYKDIKEAVDGFRNNGGFMSDEDMAKFDLGVAKIGVGFALVTGTWIPLAIAAFAIFAAEVYRAFKENGDEFAKVWDGIVVTVELARGFLSRNFVGIYNAWADMVNGNLEVWDQFILGVESSLNWLIDAINKLFGSELEHVDLGGLLTGGLKIEKKEARGLFRIIKSPHNRIGSQVAGDPDANAGLIGLSISSFDPNYFASGGYPSQGSLFWAGEAGPELVGQVGGRSTVTNQDQFMQGLADANEGVVNATYAMASMIVEAIERKNLSVRIGDKDIGQANDRYTRQRGFANTIGVFANSI